MTPNTKNNLIAVILCLFTIIFFQQTVNATPFDIMVNQISQSDYISYVMDLENFGTRFYNTAGNTSAANYIYNEFASYGLSVAYDPFLYDGSTYNNVVATLSGTTNPDNIYIVGAHFDSTSNDPQNSAPGADDNASGIASVLEIASVLSQYSFNSTIEFIAFNLEEQGLKGSKAYADEAKAKGDDILGMLNFDMIAYTGNNPNEAIDVMGDGWLVDKLISHAATYTLLSTEAHYGNYYGSDHYYFHSTTYPGSSSIFCIEDTPNEIWGGSNPYYHTTEDTSAHLNFDFAIDVTKAGVATLADIAVVVPEPISIILFVIGGIILASRRYLKVSRIGSSH
ncbi:MAG: M28 family peptidase [Candidatus Omnitrophota bacterium]